MNKTSIDYLTHTWNPVAMRCTPVSGGCRNCWHIRMAGRLSVNPALSEAQRDAYFAGSPALLGHELCKPSKLKKTSIIGVQFMGDLFHENIPFTYIDRVFAAICECRGRHTFMVLTKRPDKMLDWFKYAQEMNQGWFHDGILDLWNTYLGVSVEDQKTADERIPILLQIPAAVRWVSVEPMLGGIELKLRKEVGPAGATYTVAGDYVGIDWVVCGGETGPGARPMHPDWPRGLRDQCQAAGVPFYFKQWGEWLPGENSLEYEDSYSGSKRKAARHQDGSVGPKIFEPTESNYVTWAAGGIMYKGSLIGHNHDVSAWAQKVGKEVAGNLLDGQTWQQMPGVKS